MNEIVDVTGRAVAVGDNIAGAFREGDVAVLKFGTVLGFGERGNKLTIRVNWKRSSHGSGARSVDQIGNIVAELYRFVVVN